ncbi:MAG TPA: hypothetical protein VJ440_08980 [Candidatus Brocadiaceae bacterium]|nr:hypothetical protein [Candidatus Brocadiaceae bacterium]
MRNETLRIMEGGLEVPLAALEELVANMLLHRDYFISAPWRVMLFDNRVELISPVEEIEE